MTDEHLFHLAQRAGLRVNGDGAVWGNLRGLQTFARLLTTEHGAGLKTFPMPVDNQVEAGFKPAARSPASRAPAGPTAKPPPRA